MSSPYHHGQQNAVVTTSPPATQTLLNAGYTCDQANRFLQGYADAKK